jgi:hypothetical protein
MTNVANSSVWSTRVTASLRLLNSSGDTSARFWIKGCPPVGDGEEMVAHAHKVAQLTLKWLRSSQNAATTDFEHLEHRTKRGAHCFGPLVAAPGASLDRDFLARQRFDVVLPALWRSSGNYREFITSTRIERQC